MKGRVVRFDPERGVGSIRAADVPGGFAVHLGEVEGETLAVGQPVKFEPVLSQRGLHAANVVPLGKGVSPRITYTAGSLFMVLVATIVYAGFFGLHWLLAWLAVVNFVTLGYYWWDKFAAGSGAFRVPERTLHLLEGLGGSIGGALGRRILQHKISKRQFLLRSWVIGAIQIVVVVAYVRRFGLSLPLG